MLRFRNGLGHREQHEGFLFMLLKDNLQDRAAYSIVWYVVLHHFVNALSGECEDLGALYGLPYRFEERSYLTLQRVEHGCVAYHIGGKTQRHERHSYIVVAMG